MTRSPEGFALRLSRRASQWKRSVGGLTRRELLRRSALLTVPALWRGGTVASAAAASATASAATSTASETAAAAIAEGLRVGHEIYQSIGVRPLINESRNSPHQM